jgi:hypothetical protein
MRVDDLSLESDGSPEFDDDGYTSLADPAEDEAAFEGLLDSGLSEEEAQAAVDYMKPLSEEEESILEDHPELEGLTRVNDAEHEEWLGDLASKGTKAMDRVLEDASYGEGNMRDDEEKMERRDTDRTAGFDESGLSFRKAFKKIRRGASRAARTPFNVAKTPFKMIRKVVKKFSPNRDAAKATLVRNLYRKLWFEHANWLAQQDKASNLQLKPRAEYEAVAKLWARSEIAKQKLPLNYAVSGATILGSDIMGDDLMGSWWNPFSWFQNKTNVVLNNTSNQRTGQGPEEQASEVQQPGDMNTDVQDPSAQDPNAPDPNLQQSPDGSDQSGWNGVRQMTSPHDPVADSLGAFTAHVLGKDLPARDNPNVDEIVRAIVGKLKTGQAISPGEIGLLSSAAKEGNERARRVVTVLRKRGAVVSGDDSGSDPWLYKLSPSYWFKSTRQKEFIDKEKKSWTENAALSKQLEKQKQDLEAAERAVQAATAVEQARAQSAETEAKLLAIASSLKGDVAGSFIGHENVKPISDVVLSALVKTNKKDSAARLYAKIKAGQPLSKEEVLEARQIAKLIGKLRVVHGSLVEDDGATARMHGVFVGASVLGGISAALNKNAKQQKAADYLAQKAASGQPLQQKERDGLASVLLGQQKLRKFTSSLVSGRALAGCPKSWSKGAFVGAARALSPEDKKMLSVIVKLAKIGNPRAQKALAYLQKTGEISGADDVGVTFSLKKVFKYATAPIWLPAKGINKLFNPGGGSKGAPSPEQVRLGKLAAAQKRAAAATARARAADAQNEAEYRAQQAIAAAADAEADAADAEATAKEQAMRTAEIEAAPDIANQSSDDAQGAFVGSWTSLLGKDTRGAKAVAKANEKSPAGQKVRGAAVVFRRAKAGDPKARKAIEVMVAKAKKGDQQALRDVNAMQVARYAYEARAAAKKQQGETRAAAKKQLVAAQRERARKSRLVASEKKLKAYQARFVARTAERLARMERKRDLQKLAKVERKAAAGNPKARAFVASRVAASKKGDKKALAQVQGMTLARTYRQNVRTRQERRNMQAAQYLAKRIRANDPKAIRQFEIIKDAAAKGNPNAKRGLARLALAGAVMSTVATGVVVQPKVIGSAKKKGKKRPVPGTPEYAKLQRQVESAKAQAAAGTATREELVAKSQTAKELGDEKSAGTLLMASSKAPSATESVKKAAGQVAASKAGNPEAQAQLDSDLAAARTGNTDAINKLGQVAAARTVAAVEAGQPVPQPMRDAINLQERARAGDPAAQEVLQRVSEAATVPNPTADATAAAAYATGAAVLASSLASKPKARQELMAQVNQPIPQGEQSAAQAQLAAIVQKTNEGSVTPEEGQRGIDLAMRLGKPRVAAEISAKAPPIDVDSMSSLPDQPLAPISGVWDLFKESLKALAFATRDPLGNYREGLAARSTVGTAVTGACAGWSPFKLFMRAAPAVPALAMLSSPVAAAAAVANLAMNKSKKAAPAAPVAQATPAAPAAPATPAAPAAPAERPKTEESESAGDDSFKDVVSKALRDKKMSKEDFNRAAGAHVDAKAPKEVRTAAAAQLLKFLEKNKVKVGGDSPRGETELEAKLDPTLKKVRSFFSQQGYSSGIAVTRDGTQSINLEEWKRDTDPHVRLSFEIKHDHNQLIIERELRAFFSDTTKNTKQLNVKTFKLALNNHTKIALKDILNNLQTFKSKGNSEAPKTSSAGAASPGDEFKKLVVAALRAKKMSRDDFNKAVAVHVDGKASKETKEAAAAKMLEFLTKRKVKVS